MKRIRLIIKKKSLDSKVSKIMKKREGEEKKLIDCKRKFNELKMKNITFNMTLLIWKKE